MIKFENTEVMGWKAAIRGMRNPMNSWEKGDSLFIRNIFCDDSDDMKLAVFVEELPLLLEITIST